MTVIDFASRRPPIICDHCRKRFIVVRTNAGNCYQCPACHWWVNEYGMVISVHKCKTCDRQFTVCPPIPVGVSGWDECLADDCASYDRARDADRFFE